MISWTYSRAGIDLGRHRAMHRVALELAERLAKELGFSIGGLGGYASWISVGGRDLVLHVDGVGTKSLVAEKLERYRVLGWDCVAMNVNDVACEGAKPLALVDYVAMPRIDEGAFRQVMEGVYEAAKVARVPLLGGETAILPDLARGIDVVCTVLAEKRRGFVNRASPGDAIVGVASSGLHANGYTLVRRILESSGIGYRGDIGGVRLEEELLRPTAVYSPMLIEALESGAVTGAAHITGGAFSKVKRILPTNSDAVMEVPEPPRIFRVLMELGRVPVDEMYRVFNMGIGLVLTAPSDRVDEVLRIASRHGHRAFLLGKVVEGRGRVVLKTPWGVDVEL